MSNAFYSSSHIFFHTYDAGGVAYQDDEDVIIHEASVDGVQNFTFYDTEEGRLRSPPSGIPIEPPRISDIEKAIVVTLD